MLITATHVVFYEFEARHTTCRFFFDSFDSLLVACDEFTVIEADVESDRSVINVITCNLALLNKLQTILKQSEVLRCRLNERYWSDNDDHKLCIIISHPHGMPKQVSIGQWINKDISGVEKTKYSYTTCTCPGSAGAPVLIFSRLDHKGYHTHSGSRRGYNFSGTFIG